MSVPSTAVPPFYLPPKECEAARFKKFVPPAKNQSFPHIPATPQKRNKLPPRKWRGYGGSSRRVWEVWRVGMTDFATQNLVNSGFAALPSFQEESLSLQGLLLRLQGLPIPSSPSSALRDEPCGGQPPLQCRRRCRARRRSSIPHRRELQSVSFRSESAQCCSACNGSRK